MSAMPVQASMRRHDRLLALDATGVGVFTEVRGIGVLRDLAQGDALPATGDEQRDPRAAAPATGSQGCRARCQGLAGGVGCLTPEVAQEGDRLA